MTHNSQLCLPIGDPLAFLEASLLFTIQLLLAHRPELLLGPDEISAPYLRHCHPPERRLLVAIRELHCALEDYSIAQSESSNASGQRADEDIPF